MLHTISTETLQLLGFIFAALFVVLGAFDGIYFHLIKYKLHLFPESKLEHQIHSVRGILLGIIGGLVLTVSKHDAFDLSLASLLMPLQLALAVIVVDLVLEIVDIYVEKQSRMNLGGISSSEMVLHVFASSFRMAAVVLLMIVAQTDGFSPMVNLVGGAVSAASFSIGLLGLIPMKNIDAISQKIPFQILKSSSQIMATKVGSQ